MAVSKSESKLAKRLTRLENKTRRDGVQLKAGLARLEGKVQRLREQLEGKHK